MAEGRHLHIWQFVRTFIGRLEEGLDPPYEEWVGSIQECAEFICECGIKKQVLVRKEEYGAE